MQGCQQLNPKARPTACPAVATLHLILQQQGLQLPAGPAPPLADPLPGDAGPGAPVSGPATPDGHHGSPAVPLASLTTTDPSPAVLQGT